MAATAFGAAFEAAGATLAFALALLSGLTLGVAFGLALALAPVGFSPLGTSDLAKAQIKNPKQRKQNGLNDQKIQDMSPKV